MIPDRVKKGSFVVASHIAVRRRIHELSARSDIIVSLTSYPGRIATVALTLRSLLHQSLLPSRILLVLSLSEFPAGTRALPNRLRRLIAGADGLIDIVWVDGNTYSYKKLLPARAAHPNETLVTADDDVIYPAYWLATLRAGMGLFPDTVIGSRGACMTWSAHGFTEYKTWEAAPLMVPSPQVLLTGRGGVLYPAGALHSDVDDHQRAAALCPTADDLWFKVMSLRRGSDCVVVGNGVEYANCGSQRSALHRQNIDGSANDRALAALQREFDVIGLLRGSSAG